VSEGVERRLGVSGGELAYRDLGDPEDPAVLLLHGFPASSYLWRNVAPLLEPWMRVIAPDLLGAGDSDKPPDAQLGIEAQARYVRELLGSLGVSSFAAIGQGLGGGVAQLLALEGGVRTLVLIDSVAFEAWPSASVLDAQRRASSGTEVAAALVDAAFEAGVRQEGRLTAEDLAEASVGDLVKLAKDFTRVIQPGLDLMSPARLQVDDRSVPVTIQNLKAIVQYVHQVQEAPVSVPLPAAVEIHEVPTTDRLRRTAGQHPPTESTE